MSSPGAAWLRDTPVCSSELAVESTGQEAVPDRFRTVIWPPVKNSDRLRSFRHARGWGELSCYGARSSKASNPMPKNGLLLRNSS